MRAGSSFHFASFSPPLTEHFHLFHPTAPPERSFFVVGRGGGFCFLGWGVGVFGDGPGGFARVGVRLVVGGGGAVRMSIRLLLKVAGGCPTFVLQIVRCAGTTHRQSSL